MTFTSRMKLNFPRANFSTEVIENQCENRSFLKTACAWKGSVTPKIIYRVLWAGVYSSLIVLIGNYFPNFYLSITPFEYSGAVLGLLLVARVNAGMDRWWEARKIWGSIVNQSRNLAIIGHQYSQTNTPLVNTFLKWVAFWPYAMKEQLRDEKILAEGENLLSPKGLENVKAATHMPMYVGAKIASLLRMMRKQGLDDFSFHRAERERALLIDAIGACERIKSTPIPLVLAIKTRRFILIFLTLLPFALINKVGWMTPFIVMLTAYPLFCLDQIGVELQNPFSTANLSHLPLNTICGNIERNVLSLEVIRNESEDFDSAINYDTIINKSNPTHTISERKNDENFII